MAYSDTFYHLCCLLRICDIVRLSWVRVSSFWDWIGTPLVEPSLNILGAEGSLMINHRHNLNYTYKKIGVSHSSSHESLICIFILKIMT